MRPADRHALARELCEPYPALESMEESALAAALERAGLLHLPAGTTMFGEGSPCRQFPLVLPRPVFDELMSAHVPFRQYVFSLFAERLAEMMALVEAVAFHKLDRRVASALLGLVPLLTGLFRFCPAYSLFGLNTCPMKRD